MYVGMYDLVAKPVGGCDQVNRRHLLPPSAGSAFRFEPTPRNCRIINPSRILGGKRRRIPRKSELLIFEARSQHPIE